MLADALQLAEELRQLRGVDGGFEIEVEAEGIVGAGDRAALKLREVDAAAVDAGQHLIEAAGLVGQRHEKARPVSAGVDLRLGGDADEAGVVAVLVLHAVLQALQAVDLRAGVRGDGGQVLPAGFGDHPRRRGGIFAAGDGDVRQLLQKFGALLQRLPVRDDLADVGQLRARERQQTVVDPQADAAHDGEIVLLHEIIHRVDRTCRAVFQRQHAVLAQPLLNGGDVQFLTDDLLS